MNPETLAPPRGYSNGMVLSGGDVLFVAGQIGWNDACQFESDELAQQSAQALRNVLAVLAEAGARAEHIVRMTWYVTDKHDYLSATRDIGAVYRELMGEHYPAMSLVEVSALLEERAKVEIEATAVIPD